MFSKLSKLYNLRWGEHSRVKSLWLCFGTKVGEIKQSSSGMQQWYEHRVPKFVINNVGEIEAIVKDIS